MKRILVALLAAMSINAVAIDPASILMPSPFSIILAYNSYVKDQKKVYYIRVQSQAQDFEQAKKQAFRLASEQVAGTVVLSESELRNSKLTRNEIITYSSGLIDEYKIVDRFDGPGYVKLTMDIWITESVMAQRLLAKSATDRGIDGPALATRVDSILEERQRGDKLLMAILRDMPRHGFKTTLKPPKISMDNDRNVRISVYVETQWDWKYVNAFSDAVKQIGRKPEPLCVWNCAPQDYALNGYIIDDPQKLKMVYDYVRDVAPTLKIELQDFNGNVVSRYCGILPLTTKTEPGRTMIETDISGRSVVVGVDTKIAGDVYFTPLGQNIALMAKLNEIRAEVVPASQCKWM